MKKKNTLRPQERRRERRKPAPQATVVHIGTTASEEVFTPVRELVMDVSRQGLRFSHSAPLLRGEEIDLLLQPSWSEQVFNLRARVCWAEKQEDGLYHIGVQIISKSGYDTEAWIKPLESEE